MNFKSHIIWNIYKDFELKILEVSIFILIIKKNLYLNIYIL